MAQALRELTARCSSVACDDCYARFRDLQCAPSMSATRQLDASKQTVCCALAVCSGVARVLVQRSRDSSAA
jgi:hypothetical protein